MYSSNFRHIRREIRRSRRAARRSVVASQSVTLITTNA